MLFWNFSLKRDMKAYMQLDDKGIKALIRHERWIEKRLQVSVKDVKEIQQQASHKKRKIKVPPVGRTKNM